MLERERRRRRRRRGLGKKVGNRTNKYSRNGQMAGLCPDQNGMLLFHWIFFFFFFFLKLFFIGVLNQNKKNS
jgi:hypothetical protein